MTIKAVMTPSPKARQPGFKSLLYLFTYMTWGWLLLAFQCLSFFPCKAGKSTSLGREGYPGQQVSNMRSVGTRHLGRAT